MFEDWLKENGWYNNHDGSDKWLNKKAVVGTHIQVRVLCQFCDPTMVLTFHSGEIRTANCDYMSSILSFFELIGGAE